MNRSPLCRLVIHEFRLDILCCLDEPMTAMQVSARLGKLLTAVSYHLKLLESQKVIEKIGQGDEVLYRATLDKHPEWVAKAVREHHQRDG